MPASVDVLEARCADARNACPLNVSGGAEASLLPLPLAGIYEPVGCFTAHTMYSRRVTPAEAALGWAGPPEYLLYFSQALDIATQLEPAWYFSRLYVAYSYEYLARLRVGPTGYARARQPAWGAAAANEPWDVCAAFVPGANATGGASRCTSFRTGNAADASRWREAPSLTVACVDGWQQGADAVTPLGESCDGNHSACALQGNVTAALAGRFELAGCQSQRPLYVRSYDGASVYFDTDAGAWLACAASPAADCGAAAALAALLPTPLAPGGLAFNFSGATSALPVPFRPDSPPAGWRWAVPAAAGATADVALAVWPAAGPPRAFTFLAPGGGFACVANESDIAAAPPPPASPPAAQLVRATLQLDGALTVQSFRTPQRAAFAAVLAASLGLPPRAAVITSVANITRAEDAQAGRRKLRAAPDQTSLCGVVVGVTINTASAAEAAAAAAALVRLAANGYAGAPLAKAAAVLLPAVTAVSVLQISPAVPSPAPGPSYVVVAACVGTLVPAAAATALAVVVALQRRDARRRAAEAAAAAEARDAVLSAFTDSSTSDPFAISADSPMLPFGKWQSATGSAAASGATRSFAPMSGVSVAHALAAAGRKGGSATTGTPPAPVAPLQFGAQDVELGAVLGSGRFGVAYAASWRGTPACVKAWHLAVGAMGGAAELDAAALQAQMARISRLRHPNILSVYGFCLDAPPLLLLELGARGSLAALLRCDAGRALSWRERCRLALGVACGVAYLHAQDPPIAHLDVKCENVVLDDGLCPKVCDFGLAVFHAAASGGAATAAQQSAREAAALCATPLYAAPELSEEGAGAPLPRPLALDVFAFAAAVLHPLAHRGAPRFATPLYRHVYGAADDATSAAAPAPPGDWTPVQILVARCLAGWQPELVPGQCPPPLAELTRRCCAVDPTARPRMGEVRDELAALQDAADKW